MNRVDLVGRLTQDPDVRYAQGATASAIARFKLACDRRFAKRDDPNAQTADFISCVAFGKTAEFIEKYFRKGMKMGASGRIQTGSYTNKDGVKVYTTDVVCEEVEFVESKNAQAAAQTDNSRLSALEQGFMPIPVGTEEELPFN